MKKRIWVNVRWSLILAAGDSEFGPVAAASVARGDRQVENAQIPAGTEGAK